MTIKSVGKAALATLLEAQVKRLRKRNNFTVVAVAGSVGKTSTKLAIAEVLAAHQIVRWQRGNYNDRVTVPLVFFGCNEPSIFNVFAWLKIIVTNEQILRRPYNYDVVVVELGTDGPGQMEQFAYVQPDITVLTAITPEHMEYFGDLDAVAREELAVASYSKTLLCNVDDMASEYLVGVTHSGYGFTGNADYRIELTDIAAKWKQAIVVQTPQGVMRAQINLAGKPGAKVAAAAVSVATMLGVPTSAVTKSVENLQPAAGRMRILQGLQGVTIIDDTYNASPIAVTAALDVLYAAKAPQRIAVLGSMNEMGKASQTMHESVGAYCDPKYVDCIVTIGKMANDWLATAAQASGCLVHMTDSPYQAAEFLKTIIKPGAVILAKGSQNAVYAEEAIRPLLNDPTDVQNLVRQSPYWQQIKRAQFSDYRL